MNSPVPNSKTDYSKEYQGRTLEVFNMLHSDRLPKACTLATISVKAKISIGWLKRFSSGRCARPDAQRIDALQEFFKQIKTNA